MTCTRTKRGLLSAAAGIFVAAWAGVATAQNLVIDGETIADEALIKAARAEGTLLVYTANFENNERGMLERFKADTGINFEVVRLGTGRLFERVMTEHSAKKLPADIIGLTDNELMARLQKTGILAAHRVPSWNELPNDVKDPEGYFYAMNRYPAVIGYNTKVWTKETSPKSWADTLDPKYKGQNGVLEASAGGSSWSLVLFQRKHIDPKFWEKQAPNNPRIYNSSAQITDDIARGEITIGTVQLGLVRNLAKAGAPISLNFPKEGAPAVGGVSGINATAPHASAAKVYLNWVMTKRGGKAISEIFADYPAHPGAPPPNLSEFGIDVPPASVLWTADPKDSAELRDKWIVEWDAIYRRK